MNKKKILIVIILLMSVILIGCGKNGLSGKYVANDIYPRTLVFNNSEEVSFNNVDGTYKIENDKITLIFNGKVQQYSYTKVGDSIVIDGIEYKKSN